MVGPALNGLTGNLRAQPLLSWGPACRLGRFGSIPCEIQQMEFRGVGNLAAPQTQARSFGFRNFFPAISALWPAGFSVQVLAGLTRRRLAREVAAVMSKLASTIQVRDEWEATTAKTDARACDARPSSLFVFHPVRAAFGFSIVTRTLRLAAIAGCGRGSMRRHQSVHVVLFNSENRTRSAVLRLPVQSRKYTIFFWTSQLSVSSLQPQWCHVVRGMVRSLACKEGEKQNSKTDCHCVLLFGRHFAQGCG